MFCIFERRAPHGNSHPSFSHAVNFNLAELDAAGQFVTSEGVLKYKILSSILTDTVSAAIENLDPASSVVGMAVLERKLRCNVSPVTKVFVTVFLMVFTTSASVTRQPFILLFKKLEERLQ